MKKIIMFVLAGLIAISALGDPPPGSKPYEPEILKPAVQELHDKAQETQQAMDDAAAAVTHKKVCDSLKQVMKDAGCKTCGQKKPKKVAPKNPAPKPIVKAPKPAPCVGCAEKPQQDCSEKAIFVEPVTPCSLAGYFKTNCCADCGEIELHCKITEEILVNKIEEVTSTIWPSDQKDNEKIASHILQSKVARYSFKPEDAYYCFTVNNCTGELVRHSISGTWDGVWLYRGRPWFHSVYGPIFKEGEIIVDTNNSTSGSSSVNSTQNSRFNSNEKPKGFLGWFKIWGWNVLVSLLLLWIFYLLLRTRWTQKDEVKKDMTRWNTSEENFRKQSVQRTEQTQELIKRLAKEEKKKE